MLGLTAMSERDVLALNPLVLAGVGDAVQSLYVRQCLVADLDIKPQALHSLATASVKASAQAARAARLLDGFSQTELELFHRGRNASPHHKAKNQTAADYRNATGLEAVLGYLYLTGRQDRLLEILQAEL